MTIEERLDEMRKEDENDDGGPFYWRSRRDSPSLADIGSTVYRMMRIVEPPGGAV